MPIFALVTKFMQSFFCHLLSPTTKYGSNTTLGASSMGSDSNTTTIRHLIPYFSPMVVWASATSAVCTALFYYFNSSLTTRNCWLLADIVVLIMALLSGMQDCCIMESLVETQKQTSVKLDMSLFVQRQLIECIIICPLLTNFVFSPKKYPSSEIEKVP